MNSGEARITVSIEEVEAALLVWLRVAPQQLWLKNERYEQLKAEKRQTLDDTPDPKKVLARYLAGKLEQAKWEVTREPPSTPVSPPSWYENREKENGK